MLFYNNIQIPSLEVAKQLYIEGVINRKFYKRIRNYYEARANTSSRLPRQIVLEEDLEAAWDTPEAP